MKTITFANQKGGVGKSTSALSLGCGLMHKGFSVLFVDLDPQCNLSFMLNSDPSVMTIYDVMKGECSPQDAIQKTAVAQVIASSPDLATVDLIFTGAGKESIVKKIIEKLSTARPFDFVIIDTPPALGILTVNSLVACDYLLIPAQADILSLQGMAQLRQTYDAVKKYHNRTLQTVGVLLTRYDNRTILSRKMAEMLIDAAKYFQTTVFKERIRETVVIRESQAQQLNVFDYAPNSNAALDCLAVTDELLHRMEIHDGKVKEIV